MRALLVDPVARIVSWTEVSGLKSLQQAVGGYIEGIYPDQFSPAFAGHHGYVDEEGLLKPDKQGWWSVPGYPALVGPGLIVGTGRAGNDRDATMTVPELWGQITWLTRQDVLALA